MIFGGLRYQSVRPVKLNRQWRIGRHWCVFWVWGSLVVFVCECVYVVQLLFSTGLGISIKMPNTNLMYMSTEELI